MTLPIRILHLEDNLLDAELVKRNLERENLECEITLVSREVEFVRNLQEQTFDVILADEKLPDYDGLSALAFALEKYPEIPFIFLSGTIDEETAMKTLRRGARDYVLKDRLFRLVPCIRRALEESKEIARRKAVEEELRQAQKMESLGRLAGGVAHDFNNLLTSIIGHTSLVLDLLEDSDPIREDIEEVAKAARRASGLTTQLLAFSRKQLVQPLVLDLNAIISDMHRMLKRLIGEDIHLETLLDPSIGRIKADRGQVEQVILNLCVNSRDAMPEGGKLVIQTSKAIQIPDPHPETSERSFVVLSISDTGCGMDEHVRTRIFEPFFTTKKEKGTGLGLSTVYGIVENLGGSITFTSRKNEGTTFNIFLPQAAEAEVTAEPNHHVSHDLRGKENVLIVEDDEGVRAIVRKTLEKHGYHLRMAENAGEALLICEKSQQPIDLLITDVILPHMNGRELAERLKLLQPAMKVIYLSGYTDDEVLQRGVSQNSVAYLQKPFTPEVLLRKVRQVLDSVEPQPNLAK